MSIMSWMHLKNSLHFTLWCYIIPVPKYADQNKQGELKFFRHQDCLTMGLPMKTILTWLTGLLFFRRKGKPLSLSTLPRRLPPPPPALLAAVLFRLLLAVLGLAITRLRSEAVSVCCLSSSYYYYYHYISASLSVQCTIQRNSAQARAWRWPQHKTTDYILWLVAAAASHHSACNSIFTTLPCGVYEYEGIQSLNLFSFWHNVQAAVTSDALHPGDNLQISFITSAAS